MACLAGYLRFFDSYLELIRSLLGSIWSLFQPIHPLIQLILSADQPFSAMPMPCGIN